MALIKCGECGVEMSNKADKCPKCGAPAKKRTSLFTWIITGFLLLVFFNVVSNMTRNNSSAPPTSVPTTPSASSTSGSPTAHTPPQPKWDYLFFADNVSGKNGKTAEVTSINSFEMNFPYQGGTTGSITIRNHPRQGKDIYFSINKGQLLCTSYEGCEVLVRFDDRKPFTIHANTPEDNSSTTLFLSGYNRLVKEIEKSKTMIVEVTFFQNGTRAFEFDVSNFKASELLI